MNTSGEFLLDRGIWGWLYKLLTPLEWLMTQVMVLFHKFLTLLGMAPIGISWVLAIVFLVLVVHACILPIYLKQMKSMRKMQALQPKMQHIQNKYKGKKDQASKEAMSREMMKLYQDNDANPMGSCWTAVIQGPVFMCMFYMLSAIPYIATGKRGALGANPRLRCQRHRYLRYGQQFRKGRHRLLHPVDVRMHVVHAVQQHAQEPPQGFDAGIHVQDAAGHDLGLPDHVHLLRHHVPVRRAGVLADQQRMQPCPFLVPGVQVPDPGFPCS